MSIKPIKVTKYRCTCNRCGHVWIADKPEPKRCAGCRDPNWNRARVRKKRDKTIVKEQ